MKLLRNTWWASSPGNPLLPPEKESSFDSVCCMNPWVVRHNSEYYLYYGGGNERGERLVCLATSATAEPGSWQRHGPVLEPGEAGSFDERWCVLPHVIRRDDGRWLLYYTGNSGRGQGLAQFPGLGVAISEDGKKFYKYEGNPVIERTCIEGDPDAQGIAGGSVLRVKLLDGTSQWRYYYTGCPTLGEDIFLNQQKIICLAVSEDGLHWEKRGAVMRRRAEIDYENVAVAGPVVRQREDGSFQMNYSAIGTRWGFYSICYAESVDGLIWNRGTHYGDNLQLGPSLKRGAWESQMVEYPSNITEEDGKWRLFYCGNGYGRGGIGTAVSMPLRATRDTHTAHIVESLTASVWHLQLPQKLQANGVCIWSSDHAPLQWNGPDAEGTIWHEAVADNGLHFRVIVFHQSEGLRLTVTIHNASTETVRAVQTPLEIQIDSSAVSSLLLSIEGEERPDGEESNVTPKVTVQFGDVQPGATLTQYVNIVSA